MGGGWFIAVLMVGAVALGITTPWNVSPQQDRVVADRVQFEAMAQARLAFEYLVGLYVTKNPSFAGTLTPATVKAALPEAGALAAGEFPTTWTATVTSGTVTFCTAVPDKARPALLKKGFSVESISC